MTTLRMSEHAVDPMIVIRMSYSVSDLMNNSETIHHLDGTFPTLAQVKNVSKQKANPNVYYALLKLTSMGKFGPIYLGYDKEAQAMRTVKIFRPRMAFFPNKISRLEKRLLSLKNLPPVLPQLFMAFSFENCLVLEGLSGKTLNDRLRYARRLPELAIRFYMTEIVFAVSFLHSKQIIHRNLTLDSFWIHDNGHLKLMDYTSCVAFSHICSRLVWTLHPTHYTPPEVITGGFISKMVDMWSMGVIMYRMTTGKMPFLSTTRKDFKHAIRYASVNFSHHFTTEAQHFCAGLLAKMPIHRIGYNMPTFAAMKAHEYFAHTNWDKVLMGTTEIPHVPILFNNEMTVLECDLNLLSGLRYKLRKKPLRYNEITTRKGTELFSDANLLEQHKKKIAKDIKRQKKKQLPQDFSYLKVSNEEYIWNRNSSPIDQEGFTNISLSISQAIDTLEENLSTMEKQKAFEQFRQQMDKSLIHAPAKKKSTSII